MSLKCNSQKKYPYEKDAERDLTTEKGKCDGTAEAEGEEIMGYEEGVTRRGK